MHTGIVQVGTFCEWSSAISSSPAPTGHIVKYAAQNVAMNQINTRPPAIQRTIFAAQVWSREGGLPISLTEPSSDGSRSLADSSPLVR